MILQKRGLSSCSEGGGWLSCSVPPGNLGDEAPDVCPLLPMGDRLLAEYCWQRGAKKASGKVPPSDTTLLLWG